MQFLVNNNNEEFINEEFIYEEPIYFEHEKWPIQNIILHSKKLKIEHADLLESVKLEIDEIIDLNKKEIAKVLIIDIEDEYTKLEKNDIISIFKKNFCSDSKNDDFEKKFLNILIEINFLDKTIMKKDYYIVTFFKHLNNFLENTKQADVSKYNQEWESFLEETGTLTIIKKLDINPIKDYISFDTVFSNNEEPNSAKILIQFINGLFLSEFMPSFFIENNTIETNHIKDINAILMEIQDTLKFLK